MREVLKHTIGFWLLLFSLSLPFNFSSIPHPGIWITESLYPLTKWIGESGFGLELVSKATTSDAATLYIQMALFLFLSLLFALVFRLYKKLSGDQIQLFLHKCSIYILAFFLLKYGFDKLFQFQFYPPEPNTLFTPLGGMTKDILFWSTMGSSRDYNIFMGLIEVIPGLMLLWKKTRFLGALIGLGVLVNVFAINIGFDITVKLLSLYLVILAIYALSPWYKTLISVFFQNENSSANSGNDVLFKKPIIKRAIKGGLLIFFALELLTPYIDQGSFSGVDYTKIPYYGSYEVQNPEVGLFGDTTICRVHIHSKGYFITESSNGDFTDYRAQISPIGNSILFEDPQVKMSIEHRKNYIAFTWPIEGDKTKSLLLYQLDIDELPLKDDSYHWTVDGLMNSSKK